MNPFFHQTIRSLLSNAGVILAFFAMEILALYFLSACALTQLTGDSNTEKSYDPPHKVVVSTTQKGRVELEKLASYGEKRLKFSVTYYNKGPSLTRFGLDNIVARDSGGKCIRIYTDRDFMNEATIRAVTTARQAYGNSRYDGMVGNLPLNPQQQSIYNNSVEEEVVSQSEEMIGLASMIPVNRPVPPNTYTSGLVVLNKTPLTVFKITVAGEDYSATFNNE